MGVTEKGKMYRCNPGKLYNTFCYKYCLKQNQNASRPSEHPPVREEKCQNV